MKSLVLPNFEPSIITTCDHRRALLCVQMLVFLFWEEAFRQCNVRCSVRNGLFFLLSFPPSFLFFSILIGSEVSTRRQMVRWKLHITYLLCVCLERDSDLKRCTFSSCFALRGSAGTLTLEIWEGAERSLEGCKILGRIRKLAENDKPASSYPVSTFPDIGYTMQLPWQACRNLQQTYAVEGRSYLLL